MKQQPSIKVMHGGGNMGQIYCRSPGLQPVAVSAAAVIHCRCVWMCLKCLLSPCHRTALLKSPPASLSYDGATQGPADLCGGAKSDGTGIDLTCRQWEARANHAWNTTITVLGDRCCTNAGTLSKNSSVIVCVCVCVCGDMNHFGLTAPVRLRAAVNKRPVLLHHVFPGVH